MYDDDDDDLGKNCDSGSSELLGQDQLFFSLQINIFERMRSHDFTEDPGSDHLDIDTVFTPTSAMNVSELETDTNNSWGRKFKGGIAFFDHDSQVNSPSNIQTSHSHFIFVSSTFSDLLIS